MCIAVGHAVTLHYNPAAHTSSEQQPWSAQDTELGLSRRPKPPPRATPQQRMQCLPGRLHQQDCLIFKEDLFRFLVLFCFVLFFHAKGFWLEMKLAKLSLSKCLYTYFCSLWRKLCHNKFHSFFILIFAGDSSWTLPLGTVLLLPRLLSTLACPADAATAWNTCTSALWQKKK